MPPTRRPLRTARPVGVRAWVKDAQGVRTWVTQEDYDAWGRGELALPGDTSGGGGGGCIRWNTPSGDFEPDTIHVRDDGRIMLCVGTTFDEERKGHRNEHGEWISEVIARREVPDLIEAPADWEQGAHLIRPGLRLVDGQIERDE